MGMAWPATVAVPPPPPLPALDPLPDPGPLLECDGSSFDGSFEDELPLQAARARLSARKARRPTTV